jgi:hypothetical protein
MHGVYKECDFLLHTFAFCFFGPFLTEEGEKKKAFIFQNKKLFYAYKGIFLRFGKHFLLINIF